jgi:hypothetical protein
MLADAALQIMTVPFDFHVHDTFQDAIDPFHYGRELFDEEGCRKQEDDGCEREVIVVVVVVVALRYPARLATYHSREIAGRLFLGVGERLLQTFTGSSEGYSLADEQKDGEES